MSAFIRSKLSLASLILLVVATTNQISSKIYANDSDGPASCVPRVGTAQFPPGQPADNNYDGFKDLATAPKGLILPKHPIFLRDGQQTFNRQYQLYLAKDNNVYVKPTKTTENWRTLPLPKCLQHKISAISANDDELVVIDKNKWIYTMDNLLSSPKKWNWTSNFASPFWFGGGQQAINIKPNQWSLSVLGTLEDKNFTDIVHNKHSIAFAKVTQVVALTGDRSRITYLDPWLPKDYSYEIGSPLGGRFISESLSASSSTMFVINKYGDMYTRLYDFDISGGDLPFFRYSWQNESGKAAAQSQLQERFDLATAAIQLPAPAWQRQPKIPGTITNRISIHTTGVGSNRRELRVEGINGGQTGYWYKALNAQNWQFKKTGIQLTGQRLANPNANFSNKTLAPKQPYTYSTFLTDKTNHQWQIIIPNFDWAVTTQKAIVISPTGKKFSILFHKIDLLRQTPRNVGLDTEPRLYDTALEIPKSLEKNPTMKTFSAEFLNNHGLQQFYVAATTEELKFIPPSLPVKNISFRRMRG